MTRIFIQLIVLVASFFITWFGLRQVDWMTLLNVQEMEESAEEKLGKLYWDFFKKIEEEETGKKISDPVDSLLTVICESNHIDRDKVKLHIVRKDDINAFALPDHHLVLFTGLIEDCGHEGELCGVIAHELAHMEQGHIMKKLIKEIGLSMLISMTAGKGGPEIIREAVRILSSTAYDRGLESEADLTGVDYLINAGIDPEHFANFLFRMSAGEDSFPKQIFWITTHPGSEERTKAIIDKMEGKEIEAELILDSVQWAQLKQEIVQ